VAIYNPIYIITKSRNYKTLEHMSVLAMILVSTQQSMSQN